MSAKLKYSLKRSAIAAYLCICVALVLLLAVTIWAAQREWHYLEATLLQSEVNRIQSHAERTVGRIERDLEAPISGTLRDLRNSFWLREHWQHVIPRENQRLYAAVIDVDGWILMHSDNSREGRRLDRHWYDHVVRTISKDVVETESDALTAQDRAYDVRIPITVEGRPIGEYHVGFNVDWFEQWIAETRTKFWQRRAVLIGSVLLIVLLATTSLYYLATHSFAMRKAVTESYVKRSTEVGQLAAGLAHEIRNPLHAIRLNLYSFQRAHDDRSQLTAAEVEKMLAETIQEIDRIDHLMQELLGFAAPAEPTDEVIDLKAELQATIDFIDQEMVRSNIEVTTQLPRGPVMVRIDSGRLRQIMLNLLHNAQQAMPSGGRIDVALSQASGRAEVCVADHGSGLTPVDRQRLFEPFYSTKEDGTGLGLPLVKRFVEDAGGEIQCESNEYGGATFRIFLDESKANQSKG